MENKKTVIYHENLEKYPLTGYRDSELRILEHKINMAKKEWHINTILYNLALGEDKGEQHGKENIQP